MDIPLKSNIPFHQFNIHVRFMFSKNNTHVNSLSEQIVINTGLHILIHLGAVPVPAPRSRAHTHLALGASQGRQLLSLHAKERCFSTQTI